MGVRRAVANPIKAIERPLIAPSTMPNSMARAVPMPCEAAPNEKPTASGVLTPPQRNSCGPKIEPKIPTQKTTTEVIDTTPPSGSAIVTAEDGKNIMLLLITGKEFGK